MILQPETNLVQIYNSVDVHVPLNESGSYLISIFLNIEKIFPKSILYRQCLMGILNGRTNTLFLKYS